MDKWTIGQLTIDNWTIDNWTIYNWTIYRGEREWTGRGGDLV